MPVGKTETKSYTSQVICLKSYDYGEADKILHLYSADHGRISAMAKGAKRANSKLSGACELLALSEMQLTRGRNFDVVSQYQSLESYIGIRTDILKLACAMLYAELVHALATEGDEDSQMIFTHLQTALARLEVASERDIIPLASAFQMRLLDLAGFRPMLGHCLYSEQPVTPDIPYASFSAELGGVVLPEHRSHYPGTSWVNVSPATLLALEGCAEALDPALWAHADPAKTQKFLAYYTGRVLEKPLKAYAFVLQLLESPV